MVYQLETTGNNKYTDNKNYTSFNNQGKPT